MKKLIAAPAQEQIEHLIEQAHEIEFTELIEQINKQLPSEFRSDFRRLLDNVEINEERKQQIQGKVKEILCVEADSQ